MNWQFTDLGELVDISKGKKHNETPFDNGNHRYISIEDLHGGNLFHYTDDSGTDVYEDDVIIAWDGANAGKVGVGFQGVIGSTLARLRIMNKAIDSRFLFWFLDSNVSLIKSQRVGATIPHINGSALKKLKVPIPPLRIQKRIAEILDKADALRSKDQELIKKYDELAQAIFIDMFGDPVKNEKGWEVRKLGEYCDVGSSVRVFVNELVEDGIPFYRGTEIGSMSTGRNVVPSLFITEEHYNKLKLQGGVPKIGDLLMPSICPDGRIFEVEDERPFYFKDGRVLWIKIDRTYYNSVYLKYLLKEKFYRSYLNIASGTTFAELKIFALKDLELPVAPVNLQNQFADLENNISNQKKCATKTSDNSSNLFSTLIQKAFMVNL
jgi:type I restriction enzyme, S subunit